MLRGYFELSAEIGMELICLLGALLAFLVLLFESVRSSLTFAVMWYLYYSLYSVSGRLLCLGGLFECSCLWLLSGAIV